MNCAFRADVCPACETVIGYLLLCMLFAVIYYLLACWCYSWWPCRVLGLFFLSFWGGRCWLVLHSWWHFYHSICYSWQLQDGWVVKKRLLSTYLADIELNRDAFTSLFCPLMWTCSAKAVAAQLMQGSWTQLSMSIWSLGLLQRLQV